jgi:hypothetical protein
MIKIAEKLKPFSHQSGILWLVPNSHFAIQIFPHLLKLFRWDLPQPQLLKEYHLVFAGDVSKWTVQTDLEKGKIFVWGFIQSEYLHYEIACYSNKILLKLNRSPESGIHFKSLDEDKRILRGESLNLISMSTEVSAIETPILERLSLGNHKSQDWDLIKRRLDLKEIFPIWHRLSQWIPSKREILQPLKGMGIFFQQIEEILNQNRPDRAAGIWKQFFRAAYQGVLVPAWKDEQYQGIVEDYFTPDYSPLILLTEGLHLMRRHFIQQEDLHVSLLPTLLPEFHCGRLLAIHLDDRGLLNMEWTKKVIRRFSFYSSKEQNIFFDFRHVKKCRFKSLGDKSYQSLITGQGITLEKNRYYIFDNFQ